MLWLESNGELGFLTLTSKENEKAVRAGTILVDHRNKDCRIFIQVRSFLEKKAAEITRKKKRGKNRTENESEVLTSIDHGYPFLTNPGPENPLRRRGSAQRQGRRPGSNSLSEQITMQYLIHFTF
jgi:hypothetical protein